MRQKKRDKQSDLSTEFMQAIVDQDSKHTVEILTNCSDTELRRLIKSFMTVATMLLGYAVKRGLDVSKEARIVIKMPNGAEDN